MLKKKQKNTIPTWNKSTPSQDHLVPTLIFSIFYNMAIPIAATPTLEGEDAERFYKELEENEGKTVSEEEIRRGKEIFDAVMRKNPKMAVMFGYVES